MESFIDFVTDRRIIEYLCKKRAKEAAKRHELHHRHAISCDYEINDCKNEIYQLTPPRRQWIQLGKRRRKLNNSSRQTISSLERTRRSVLYTILKDRESNKDEPYLHRLNLFIDKVRKRITNPSFEFKSLETFPVLKKQKNDNTPDEYRPISLFKDLSDSLIIALANQYLSKLLDESFYVDSLAFRPKRNFHGEMKTTFHHDAITLIKGYLTKNYKRSIYVAECDMQKFYDTVDHDVVKEEFNKLIDRAKEKYPDTSFDAVINVFNAYLNCYNFKDNVWKNNDDKEYWKGYNVKSGVFGWVDSFKNKDIVVGVPQGGAISGLIANIVMNRVDNVIQPLLHEKNDIYIRYCDDMILLSTNYKRCKKLFGAYTKEIKKARLIPHGAKEAKFGTPDYWNTKTKKVYKWIDNNKSSGSRWIGFVGYEISRTGDVRIRKSSFKKEIRKQKRVVNDLLRLTYKKHRVSNQSMTQSYRSTLISMAVGRAALWNYKDLKNEMCWINGFKMLTDNPIVCNQIKELDRCQHRVIYHTNKMLDKQESIVGGEIPKEGNNNPKKHTEINEQKIYYGKPFSYYYHFEKNVKPKK